jgi:hypothetical protein
VLLQEIENLIGTASDSETGRTFVLIAKLITVGTLVWTAYKGLVPLHTHRSQVKVVRTAERFYWDRLCARFGWSLFLIWVDRWVTHHPPLNVCTVVACVSFIALLAWRASGWCIGDTGIWSELIDDQQERGTSIRPLENLSTDVV